MGGELEGYDGIILVRGPVDFVTGWSAFESSRRESEMQLGEVVASTELNRIGWELAAGKSAT